MLFRIEHSLIFVNTCFNPIKLVLKVNPTSPNKEQTCQQVIKLQRNLYPTNYEKMGLKAWF